MKFYLSYICWWRERESLRLKKNLFSASCKLASKYYDILIKTLAQVGE